MDPTEEMKISILKDKILETKAQRYSAIVSGQAAKEIGKESEITRLAEIAGTCHKTIDFFQKKLAEIEKPAG